MGGVQARGASDEEPEQTGQGEMCFIKAGEMRRLYGSELCNDFEVARAGSLWVSDQCKNQAGINC